MRKRRTLHSSAIREVRVNLLHRRELVEDWINGWASTESIGFIDYDEEVIRRLVDKTIISAILCSMVRRSKHMEYDKYYEDFTSNLGGVLYEIGFSRWRISHLWHTDEHWYLYQELVKDFSIGEKLTGYEVWVADSVRHNFFLLRNTGDKRIMDWYKQQENEQTNLFIDETSGDVNDHYY